MIEFIKKTITSALAVGLLLAYPALTAQETKGHLASPRWLEANLKRPDILVLDASPAQAYTANHIPGAVSVDIMAWYGVQEVPASRMEELLQSWGVSPGKTIVMYDQGGTFLATRLFFSLYYCGFPSRNLWLLDGGLSKWKEAGLPVTKDLPLAPRKGTYTIRKTDESVRVRLPEFLEASGDPGRNALLEALGPDWHFGQVAPLGRAGHIPHGILLPSADFFNPDKTFKSAEDIERMVTYLGIQPDQRIYTYCGGGMAASVPFFALKFILGYPTVKLYTESELGWLSDERGLPYWTYDIPSLLRDSAWLQAWGGRMLRMFGGARVSIVDVRPPAAFNEGHVPFALNVPAGVFRSHIGDPNGLADILGAAGIDPSHEAVIISGSGLTKDAALAFALLEKGGQGRVSVLMDSLEEWAKLGFAVTKEATIVGPSGSPQDVSIAATAYPRGPRPGVIISDPSATRGLFPKVFIASGPDMPLNAPAGQVVHVPCQTLLNADGRPKAAKEIWSILTKSGVPRYAELVCFAEDPGDAAATYFVLKLMGFPDIKIMVI